MTWSKNKDIPYKLLREKGKNFAIKSYPHENFGDFLNMSSPNLRKGNRFFKNWIQCTEKVILTEILEVIFVASDSKALLTMLEFTQMVWYYPFSYKE